MRGISFSVLFSPWSLATVCVTVWKTLWQGRTTSMGWCKAMMKVLESPTAVSRWVIKQFRKTRWQLVLHRVVHMACYRGSRCKFKGAHALAQGRLRLRSGIWYVIPVGMRGWYIYILNTTRILLGNKQKTHAKPSIMPLLGTTTVSLAVTRLHVDRKLHPARLHFRSPQLSLPQRLMAHTDKLAVLNCIKIWDFATCCFKVPWKICKRTFKY